MQRKLVARENEVKHLRASLEPCTPVNTIKMKSETCSVVFILHDEYPVETIFLQYKHQNNKSVKTSCITELMAYGACHSSYTAVRWRVRDENIQHFQEIQFGQYEHFNSTSSPLCIHQHTPLHLLLNSTVTFQSPRQEKNYQILLV